MLGIVPFNLFKLKKSPSENVTFVDFWNHILIFIFNFDRLLDSFSKLWRQQALLYLFSSTFDIGGEFIEIGFANN